MLFSELSRALMSTRPYKTLYIKIALLLERRTTYIGQMKMTYTEIDTFLKEKMNAHSNGINHDYNHTMFTSHFHVMKVLFDFVNFNLGG